MLHLRWIAVIFPVMSTYSQPNVSVMKVTPSMAQTLLKTNTSNRSVRKNRVKNYATQMRRGQWQLTGDPIRISSTGRLLDGQHRLLAIIESDTAIETIVIEGLADATFTVIDSGLARTPSDALAFAGVGSAAHIAPIVRIVIGIESELNIYNSEAMSLVTRQDIVDYVENNTDALRWAVSMGSRLDSAVDGIRTAWGVFAIIASTATSVAEVEEFMNGVASGAGLVSGDPRLALRNWLARQRNWHSNSTKDNVATFIRVFNTFMNDKPMTVIRPYTRDSVYPKVDVRRSIR